MKKILNVAVALLCALGLPAALHAQLTTPTASHIYMGGVPIAAGTVMFTPVNAQGIPIAFSQGGGGLNAPTAFTGTITAGAITGAFQVPDACLTTPANILYSIQVTNTATLKSFTLQAVPNVCGSTWPLDSYGPPSSSPAVQSVQISYGTGVAPDPCVTPSIYLRNSGGGSLYACIAGHPVAIAGSTYTPPTGTGFSHITAGALDGASRAIDLSSADVTSVLPFAKVGGADPAGAATAAVNATAIATAIKTQTGCNTAGYVWQPQSNNCVASAGGAVASVNGHTGTVVLAAADVGADASGAAATAQTAAQAASIPVGQKNAAGGVAPLDSSTKVPLANLYPMVASGSSHAAGYVPDPGATAGTTKYLREDGSWTIPAGSGSLADPGANGVIYRSALNTTAPATPAQLAAALADATKNTAWGFSAGSGGDSSLPTPVVGTDYFGYKAGGLSFSKNGAAYVPFLNGRATIPLSCQPGIGDGLNAIPAGTYLTTTCRNETGGTWTISSIKCVADAGSPTCNVTNGAGTALLTGAITGTSTYATGTQSGTTTIASGDYLKVTFVVTGTAKQVGIDVAGSF